MIDKSHIKSWQNTVDILAEMLNVPAALIMAIQDDSLEVFVSSHSNGNPYNQGESELYDDSGLYCERVIKTKAELLVPNALKDNNWKDNPDIKLGMISYYGLPLLWPDGTPFGTICVLDKQENAYSSTYKRLLENLKDRIELDLVLIHKESEIQKKNQKLEAALKEIKTLQGIIPICSYCHSIRNDEGAWKRIESYISEHSDVQFSHSVCPNCLPKARSDAGLGE